MRTVRYVGWALISCAVLAVYAPLLGAPALTWDDGEHIFDNAEVRNGDFAAMWRSPSFGLYVPLMRTIWAITYQLGHGEVWPFRLLNLLLHIANVALVALLVRQQLAAIADNESDGRESRAALANTLATLAASALMALHPAQVAAVAWISGARDLLSTTFALLAWWLIARPRSRWPVHAVATAAFAAALLSKPQVVALPVAIAVHWWIAQRSMLRERRFWLLLWTGLAVGGVLLTRYAQPTESTLSMSTRLFVAVDAALFYLRLLVWPMPWPWPLSADYGRTPAWLLEHRTAVIPGLVTFAILTSIGLTLRRRTAREHTVALASAIAFGVLLSPVLGLLPFSYQRISTVADHYLYLPMAAAALCLAALVERAAAWWSGVELAPSRSSILLACAGILAVICGGALSVQRAQVWAGGDERFYRAMLASNDQSWSARVNLSVLLCERGEADEGLTLLDSAGAAAETDAPYLANRSFCLMRAGRAPQVIALARVLTRGPARSAFDKNHRAATVFVNSVAEALHVQGDEPSAFAYLCWARALSPSDTDIATNLAVSTRMLSENGPPVTCPEILSWELLGQIVSK